MALGGARPVLLRSPLFDCYFRRHSEHRTSSHKGSASAVMSGGAAEVLCRIDTELSEAAMLVASGAWRAELQQMRSLVKGGVVSSTDFQQKVAPLLSALRSGSLRLENYKAHLAVSYTHLTLPTICSV